MSYINPTFFAHCLVTSVWDTAPGRFTVVVKCAANDAILAYANSQIAADEVIRDLDRLAKRLQARGASPPPRPPRRKVCPTCNGPGRLIHRDLMLCPTCSGLGTVPT